MKKVLLVVLITALLLALFATPVLAQGDGEAKTPDSIATDLDTVWVLLAAALVFFMQAGFFFLEGGLTRAKNVANAMLKGVMDFCLGAIIFWMVGFGLMFGLSRGGFVGSSGFF